MSKRLPRRGATLAKAIIEEYQPKSVEDMQNALKEALLKASYVEELADIYYRCLTVLGHEPETIPADELAKWKYPTEIKA